MSDKQIFASYFLYNSIFVEQKLDLDHFGQTEQYEILNIATISFLVIDIFIKHDQDVIISQQYIKNNFPKPLITVSLDTLEDLIALDNNIRTHLKKEYSYFERLGEYYYAQTKPLFSKHQFETQKSEEFFTLTMFCVESMLLLDQCDYSVAESIELVKDHEYEQSLVEILSIFQ